MSRHLIRGGKIVEDEIVGVNQNGKYHHKSCRFYENCEEDMKESVAISMDYICGECCNNA